MRVRNMVVDQKHMRVRNMVVSMRVRNMVDP